jgi:hypothetical protein
MSGCCSIFFAAAVNKKLRGMSFVFERREERCCNILQTPQHPANFLVSYCVPVNEHPLLQDVDVMKKTKKNSLQRPHDSVLWVRLCFIIRVETGWDNEPQPFKKLRALCSDIPLDEFDFALSEMVRSARVRIHREWDEAGAMTETFTNNE